MAKKNVDETLEQPVTVSSETVSENTKIRETQKPVVDLTGEISGQWPGNTPHRVGHFYFNLDKLTLSEGQKALIGSTAENFVFERVDAHGIEAPNVTTDIEIMLDDGDSMGRFVMEESSKLVKRVRNDKPTGVMAGSFMSKKKIFLQMNNPPVEKGRIVVNFVGYLIEPWR